MPKHALEEQLAVLTREFVGKLVEVIRNASFAEVAALPGPQRATAERAPRSTPRLSPPRKSGGRQTKERRAELGERLVRALGGAKQPIGVRALAGELGVPPDVLAAPIRELRQAGKIRKHGDKRSTAYSLA
jgi:hypothetical protein